MEKIKCCRHGEITFATIKELPKNLKLATTKTIKEGSEGNGHRFDYGELYFSNVDEYVLIEKDE